MNSTSVAIWWALAAMMTICTFSVAGAQALAPAGADARRQEVLAAAREIMQAAGVCAVITVDESGRPQARAIDAFAPEPDMVVWFATNPKSRKVAQIQHDARVTLYYFDHPSMSYVTLLGRARLVDDPAEKQKRWKDSFKMFWPDRDKSYLLVKVTPERLEVISPKHKLLNEPVTWAPVAIEFP